MNPALASDSPRSPFDEWVREGRATHRAVEAALVGLPREMRRTFWPLTQQSEDLVEIVKLGIFVVFGSLLTLRGLFADGWAAVAILCGAMFLDAMDVSTVNVALPSIGSHLHMSPSTLQWVVSGYVLGYGGFLLLGGRASDLLGLSVPEIKNRATISGAIEIGRHPGVIQVTFRAPADRLEARGLLGYGVEQYGDA